MNRPLLALLAGTTLLAGCNLAPKYLRPAGAVPATLPAGGVYPVSPTDAPDPTRIGWRDFFVDPRLQGVIALGIENNRNLRVAAANVLQARAQYRVQRADLVPTTGLTGTGVYT
ncbi:MAG: transporter, partial [Sphingomonas sp.]